MSWSSGKDSAWALYKLQQNPEIELVGLFCTVSKAFDRVAMHGVRVELLRLQAERADLPLQIIEIPSPCSNADYEILMGQFVADVKSRGVEHIAFGDLFLEDIRSYREEKLKNSGITPIFPIWGMPTDKLSREMVDAGLRAIITCIDPEQAPKEFAGREFDQNLLDSLPETVDPCGENGEFHSFVFDGLMFREPIAIEIGDIVHRDGFVFADVLQKSS